MSLPAPAPSQSPFHSRLLALRFALEQISPLVIRLDGVVKDAAVSNAGNDQNEARHTDHSQSESELGTEINARLASADYELAVVRNEASTPGAVGQAYVAFLNTLEDDLKRTRLHFHRAQMQAKRNRDSARLRNRENLYAGTLTGRSAAAKQPQQHQHLTEDDLVAAASSDITLALKRTHRLMVSELSRSEFANSTLAHSSEALSSLNSSYASLGSLLSSSRALVRSLMHTQKSDTWYLETTVYVLIGTIAWLVFRRLLYGPMWWIVWFPMKFPLKAAFEIICLAFLYLQRFMLSPFIGSADYKNITSLAPTGEIQKELTSASSTSFSVSAKFTGAAPDGKIPVIQTHQSQQDETYVLDKTRDIATKQTADEKIKGEEERPRNPHKRMHVENLRDEL